MPAAGDHRAGDREPAQHALARAVRVRLLAHPGHQEDVVVDAERDEEHEATAAAATGRCPGSRRSRRRRTTPTPSAAAKERITVSDRAAAARRARAAAPPGSGRRRAASSGMITRLSRARDWRRSCSCAVGPPTSALGAAGRLRDRAQSRDQVERVRSSTGRRCSVDGQPRARRARLAAGATWLTTLALAPSAPRRTAGALRAVAARSRRSAREEPAGKLRATTFWPCDGLDLAAERVAARQPGVEVEQVRRRARAARPCR